MMLRNHPEDGLTDVTVDDAQPCLHVGERMRVMLVCNTAIRTSYHIRELYPDTLYFGGNTKFKLCHDGDFKILLLCVPQGFQFFI